MVEQGKMVKVSKLLVLAGYNENEFLLLQDFDASPDLSFTNSIGQEAKDLSLEARLSGWFQG